MNKKLLLASIALGLVGLVGINFMYGNIFKKAGEAIKGAASDVGKTVSKGASTVGSAVSKGASAVGSAVSKGAAAVGSKTQDCAKMTALGTEWAAKEVAYNTAKGALTIAQGAVTAAKGGVTESLNAAKALTGAAAKLMTLTSEALSKGLNITKIYFSGNVKDLTKGKLPEFQIQGTIFGKQINTTLQLDLGDPVKAVKALIEKVF